MVEQGSSEKPKYIPAVQFGKSDLLISFDHALEAKPEELLSKERFCKPGSTTVFLVRPDDKYLYFGLHFVPRRILSEVIDGLKSYREVQSFTNDQLWLINHGVDLLERFINPIEED